MAIWHAFIMGIIEGLTEFLPVSSTAHLALSAKLMGLPETEFLKSFEIVIQFGAILAVVYLYGKEMLKHRVWFWKIIVAFIPTGIIGLMLYKIIKNILLADFTVMAWALLIGGVFLVVFELLHKEKENADADIADLSWGKCALIGVFQAMAVVPGVSRSAATIIGGLMLNISRKTIVEFSFLLAVPTMLMASAYDLYKNGATFVRGDYLDLAIGFILSFIVAILAIKSFLSYIRKNNFIPFGVYRIVIGLIFLLFLL